MNGQDKLDRWAQRELDRHAAKIIVEDNQGSVFAFGRYLITPSSYGALVTRNSDVIAEFTSRAAAISWCVADRYNNVNLARKIMGLDQNRRLLRQDLDLRRLSADRSREPSFRERVYTKISNKQLQLKRVETELHKMMDQAKYMQIQGSQHETSRTRRA